jgi:serine/threonine protein kinase
MEEEASAGVTAEVALVAVPEPLLRAHNRFEFVRPIGQGGMGVVYEVFDRERQAVVAWKTLSRSTPVALYQFKREFRLVADLHHPNIVSLHELFIEQQRCFFTMELVYGRDLLSWLRGAETQGNEEATVVGATVSMRAPGQVWPRDAIGSPAHLVTSTAEALTASCLQEPAGRSVGGGSSPAPLVGQQLEAARHTLLHLAGAIHALHCAGVVHRDVKPSNVLVTGAGRVVLMDLGVAGELMRQEGGVVGTPAYMAPEQAAGAAAGPAADWYAFGAILYELLNGERPVRGTVAQILRTKRSGFDPAGLPWVEGVPSDLRDLCTGLLQSAPGDRPLGEAILRVLGGHSRAARRTHPAAEMSETFVGRAYERDQLCALLEGTSDACTVAVVVGPSGIGKSSLVRQVLAWVRQRGVAAVCLQGRCHERELVPYKGLDGIIDALSVELRTLPPAVREELLCDDFALTARMFPVLGELASTGGEIETGVEASVLRARGITALHTVLRRMAAHRALAIWIDDVQWATDDTFDLLTELLAGSDEGRGFMLLLSQRPEGEAAARIDELVASLPAARRLRLELQPLTPAEEKELAGAMLSPDQLETVQLASAGGNPLFLLELIRAMRRDPGGDSTLAFDEAVRRRVAALPRAAQALLDLVAVAGEPTPFEPLTGTLALSPAQREDCADLLRKQHLLRFTGLGAGRLVDMFHDRIREAIGGQIEPQRFRGLHERLATALGSLQDLPPARLARHWEAAGHRERAVECYVEAARRGCDKLSFASAAEYYRRALATGVCSPAQELSLRLARADALAKAGQGQASAEEYARAGQLATGDQVDLCWERAAEQLLRAGELTAGMSAMRTVLSRVGVSLPQKKLGTIGGIMATRFRLWRRGLEWKPTMSGAADGEQLRRIDLIGFAAVGIGYVSDQLQSAYLAGRLLELAFAAGDAARVCRAMSIWIQNRAAEGTVGRPWLLDALRRLEELAASIEDSYTRGMAVMAQGQYQLMAVRYDQAIEPLRRAVGLFAACPGARWEELTASWLCQAALMYQDRLDEVERSVADLGRRIDMENDIYAELLLATEPNIWCALRADRPALADALLARSSRVWPAQPFTVSHYRHAVSRTWIHMYKGDHASALAAATAALRCMRGAMLDRVPLIYGHVAFLWGFAAVGAGVPRAVQRAIGAIRRAGIAAFEGVTEYLLGALAARCGQRERACWHLERAEAATRLHGFFIQLTPAVQYRRGKLLGGPAGRALCRQALLATGQAGYRRPLRVYRMVAPWWPASEKERHGMPSPAAPGSVAAPG